VECVGFLLTQRKTNSSAQPSLVAKTMSSFAIIVPIEGG
jgi:hypothetical protein